MVPDEITRVVKTFAQRLEQEGIKFNFLVLFGSYASGKWREDSDIDIAVISEEFGRDRIEERKKLWKIAVEVDMRIEPHPISLQDYKEGWKSFIYRIKKEGIEFAA